VFWAQENGAREIIHGLANVGYYVMILHMYTIIFLLCWDIKDYLLLILSIFLILLTSIPLEILFRIPPCLFRIGGQTQLTQHNTDEGSYMY
jgi:hypothetical protein